MVENVPPDTAKTYSEMFRVAAATQDVADYHDAIAGRDVGRIGKNFAKSDVDPQTGEKGKEASSRLQRTLDWWLLNDANYARIHATAMSSLVSAESIVSDGLTDVMQALADERGVLEGMEDRAARLDDGTIVFRKANGEIVDADDNPIPDHLTAGIEWRGDEPSYEEYSAQRNRVEALEQSERELRGIETELGDIRGELTDQQEPPTEDRLDQLTQRIGELQQRTLEHSPNRDEQQLTQDSESFTREAVTRSSIPTIIVGG